MSGTQGRLLGVQSPNIDWNLPGFRGTLIQHCQQLTMQLTMQLELNLSPCNWELYIWEILSQNPVVNTTWE